MGLQAYAHLSVLSLEPRRGSRTLGLASVKDMCVGAGHGTLDLCVQEQPRLLIVEPSFQPLTFKLSFGLHLVRVSAKKGLA